MKQNQLELPLITHSVEGGIVPQRIVDGYVNATELCKKAGKEFKHYEENKTTQEFLDVLSAEVGIPTSELVQIRSGGTPELQGTWVHPQVAINLATWLSPKFAVQVSKWVYECMSGKFAKKQIPYHLQRYLANMSEVPPTHFSILNELTYALIAPLESNGYNLPENMWPDISEGLMFCEWLRTEKKLDPNTFPQYIHRFIDGRSPVKARLYPNELLPDFKRHFYTEWLPKKAKIYFEKRDPDALKYLPYALTNIDATEYLQLSTVEKKEKGLMEKFNDSVKKILSVPKKDLDKDKD